MREQASRRISWCRETGSATDGEILILVSRFDAPTNCDKLSDFRQQNAFEQAELIWYAALDPTVASRARKGEFVRCFDHFDLLQTAIN
jgi:hypothetical protein